MFFSLRVELLSVCDCHATVTCLPARVEIERHGGGKEIPLSGFNINLDPNNEDVRSQGPLEPDSVEIFSSA